MKLLRYGPPGQEKPAALDRSGRLRDLSAVVPDIAGATLAPPALARLAALDLDSLPEVPQGVRLGACVGGVRNLLCIGLNYSDHAAEAGLKLPTQPLVFSKHTSALAGPDDPIVLGAGSEKGDWEVELGVVIGSPCWHVSAAEALDYVAGYCLVNDVSERAWQMEMEGQWIKGKSSFSFAPAGPWLLTRDEVPDPQAIDLWLDVNGRRMQTGTTSRMIFGVAEIVAYLSRFMALLPGDLIATGTPPGVGLGFKPPIFLRAGDSVRLGGSGLGEQNQRVVAFRPEMAAAWRRGEVPPA
ncbi:MAG: fumarylacetoacetate hydrolase family protein [Rhodocyclaceae bacterium]|nr:fumarylacetoacetate hydrolase family protein [Rhodocyclaceae bacterium]MBX3670507.1 fumarylacetoacetate hydrolase family protein [Rhodocyclaceae bacterium]